MMSKVKVSSVAGMPVDLSETMNRVIGTVWKEEPHRSIAEGLEFKARMLEEYIEGLERLVTYLLNGGQLESTPKEGPATLLGVPVTISLARDDEPFGTITVHDVERRDKEDDSDEPV